MSHADRKNKSMPERAKVVQIDRPLQPAAATPREAMLAARNLLVDTHLHLVPPIARKVKQELPVSFELDDLVQEGNIGLMIAATRYRPAEHNGTPFSAYARPRIRGAILDSIRRRKYDDHTLEPLEREASTPNTIEISIDAGRRAKRVRRAVTELQPRLRAVITGHFGGGRTLAELAPVLGRGAGSLSHDKREALDELRGLLRAA